jgi:hypothetical protein
VTAVAGRRKNVARRLPLFEKSIGNAINFFLAFCAFELLCTYFGCMLADTAETRTNAARNAPIVCDEHGCDR